MEKARGDDQAWLGGRGSAHILRSGSPRAQRSADGAPGVYPELAPMPNSGTRPGPLRVGSSRAQPCNASGLAQEGAKRTPGHTAPHPRYLSPSSCPCSMTGSELCRLASGDQGSTKAMCGLCKFWNIPNKNPESEDGRDETHAFFFNVHEGSGEPQWC